MKKYDQIDKIECAIFDESGFLFKLNSNLGIYC